MTDNNNKKTLGLKSGTLSLNKGNEQSGSTAVKQSPKSAPKGKVVVVTKHLKAGFVKSPSQQNTFKSSAPGTYIPENERDKRLQLLRNAEISKRAELQKKAELIEKEAAIEQEHAVAKKAAIEQEHVVAKEAVIEKEKSVKTDGLKQLTLKASESKITEQQKKNIAAEIIKPSKPVEKPIQRIMLNDIVGLGKVKNLDSLHRPEKKVESEVVSAPSADKKPAAKPALGPDKPALKSKKSFDDEVAAAATPKKEVVDDRKAPKKLSVAQVMMMDGDEAAPGKRRSLASIRRARDKVKRKMFGDQKSAEKIIREVNIPDVISVAELSNRMAEKSADVIKALMKMGMMVTLNQIIDADTAELVVSELGHKTKRVTDAEMESALLQRISDDKESLLPRSPVVTIMGHVDHGKTSLLDALRSTDVAAGEAGGITQHIGAYQVHLKSGKIITFLDTPGHEAFTAMRMRGAQVTDIVVLVVAADDGIMQQTVEAISHAKAANVPIIVAVNKIDKPGANPERVKHELLQHGLVSDDMGGDVMIVEVSAKQRLNLDKLEETILLQADYLDLKANPNRQAEGAIVESKIEKGRGVVSTLLVQKGSLRVGDIIVAGSTCGKIKALINDKGQQVTVATPSMPIEVLGLESAPVAGDEFSVVSNDKTARDLISLRVEKEKQRKLVASKSITLDQLFKRAKSEGIRELPVIIKADVQGSIEAIANSLQKLGTDEIAVRVLHTAVGGITESDVALASASRAIIIGFNVRASQQAKDMSKVHGIDIRYYSIIYNIIDEIKAAMSGMLSPTIKETITGYAEVRDVFDLTKYGKVAGCYITEGTIKRGTNARIIRDSVVLYDGKLKALRRFKDDVKEVTQGFECGLSFENYEDLKVGDRIEGYEVTEHARTI